MGREDRKLHGQQHCRSEGEQLKRSSDGGLSFLGLEVLLLFRCRIQGFLDVFVMRVDHEKTAPHGYGFIEIAFPIFLETHHGE